MIMIVTAIYCDYVCLEELEFLLVMDESFLLSFCMMFFQGEPTIITEQICVIFARQCRPWHSLREVFRGMLSEHYRPW